MFYYKIGVNLLYLPFVVVESKDSRIMLEDSSVWLLYVSRDVF